MRFLLIAYDFPPIPSPQSLRWAYLVRELALQGHEVHVLTADVPGYGPGGLPAIPGSVRVHRSWPGPLTGYLARRQRAKRARAQAPAAVPAIGESPRDEAATNVASAPAALSAPTAREAQRLNWKGRLMEKIHAGMGLFLFPDARGEWVPSARRLLDRLFETHPPDVVVTSHEPPNSIPLGLHAKRRGFAWIADLGDPVLAPYTPRRWRRHALRLERRLCARADLVTVTSARARAVLHERHGLPEARCVVLTQGYDQGFSPAPAEAVAGDFFAPDRLELLYSGSFYAFRPAGALLQAVLTTPGARLTIATVRAPEDILDAAARHPDRIRLLGHVSHRRILALQRGCDVLVNLANADPVQIPGKLYEYLGSGTAVLGLGASSGDAATHMLEETGAGWNEPNDYPALSRRLAALAAQKRERGRIDRPFSDREKLEPYSWESLSRRLAALASALPPRPAPTGGHALQTARLSEQDFSTRNKQ